MPKIGKTKTILMTGFHPLIARNILETPIVSSLRSDPDLRLVVLVPDFKIEYFKKLLPFPSIVVEGVALKNPNQRKWAARFERFAHAMLDTDSTRIAYTARLKAHGRRKEYFFLYLPAHFLGRWKLFRRAFRALDYRFTPARQVARYFDRYKPNLLFSTDATYKHDIFFMFHAKRLGIRTISMVRSFDNLTKLGILRILPDMLLTWSEALRKEAIRFHDARPERVKVVGIPHYDAYIKNKRSSREEFLKKWNIPADKKIIFYSPTGEPRIRCRDADKYIMEILAGLDCAIFVRMPPTNPVDLTGFSPPARMVFDRPGILFANGRIGEVVLTREDDERLAEELFHADIVICGPSTIAVDAALFNKPTILVNFHNHSGPFLDENMESYGANHLQYILRSGGVRRADSREELLRWIGVYLKEPEKDAAGRKALAEEQCGYLDGKSSERVVNALRAMMEERR